MSSPYAVDGLTITPHLAAALAAVGIAAPTAVQRAAVPVILSRQPVAISSGTGTGKTLAYALPLLQLAAATPTFRVVVMAPSPELAVQILRTIEACKEPHVLSVGLIGGGSLERQRDKLKKHPQIMVGTPGRVLQLIQAKKIKTAQISALVLDELDEILSEPQSDLLCEILSRPECKPQILCVSALFGDRARRFIDTQMGDSCAQVVIKDAPQTQAIRHTLVPYSQQRKDPALLTLLHKLRIDRAIIFVNRLVHVGHLFRVLAEADLPVVTISGERGKQDRERAMRALRGDKPCILVATDAAARGLDVKALDWIIHYEMARDVPTYLHRSGRTGRAGRQGTSLAMVAADQQHLVRQCEQELGIAFHKLA